jgi:hypothetical protein
MHSLQAVGTFVQTHVLRDPLFVPAEKSTVHEVPVVVHARDVLGEQIAFEEVLSPVFPMVGVSRWKKINK